MSIATYLTALDRDRDALAANLTTKGVPASSSETFTTLVPKVLDIPSGGGSDFENVSTINAMGTLATGASGSNTNTLAAAIKKVTISNCVFTNSAGQQALAGFWGLEELTFDGCTFGDNTNVAAGLVLACSNSGVNNVLKKINFKNCTISCPTSYNLTSPPLVIGCSSSSSIPNAVEIDFSNITVDSDLTNLRTFINGFGISKITGLNSIDVTNITDFQQTFYSCSVTSLDLSSWNPSNATKVSQMFRYCSNLQTLDLSSFDFSHITSSTNRSNLFGGVPTDCTIYVKDAATQTLLTSWDSTHTYTLKT